MNRFAGGCVTLERLTRGDKRTLLIWIACAAIGLGVAWHYFPRAFPEASVDFRVTRAEALDRARQFVVAQGGNLTGTRSTIIFDVDDTAKTYLEREVGLKRANQMMASDVSTWYWSVRFFRPLQQEEYAVRLDPSGRVVGYEHVIKEDAPGASLDGNAARAAAEAFASDTLGKNLADYDFLPAEANSTERPNRRDWSFTWERHGFRAKDAPYRMSVSLEGDRLGEYKEFLKVPEAWISGYDRLRSSNDFIETLAIVPYAMLLGACLWVIIVLGREGQLEWKTGLALGVVLAGLYFAMTMNQWPDTLAEYRTNASYSSFVFGEIAQAIVLSISMALLVVAAVVPGEPLYRAALPGRLRVGTLWRLPGLRSREFFKACVIGLCLAAASIGYQVVFYIVAGHFGAWAPQDIQYDNVVSTALPWIFPLTIGLYAAASEEFLFRMFAIPFVRRVTNSTFLAVVLPAFAWGFLHSNYPQEPPYIRGLEVGLFGIVAGLVMLRWGILATLVWHYTVDATLSSLLLVHSSSLYLRVSGLLASGAMLIPLAIAGVFYLKRGGFEFSEALLNRAVPAPAALAEAGVETGEAPLDALGIHEAPAAARRYDRISGGKLAILVACGLLGGILLWRVKTPEIGNFVRFSTDAQQATASADQVMRAWHLDPASYHHAATVTYRFNDYANEFLRRAVGVYGANRIYEQQVPSAFWAVRYFRDAQREEYMVVLHPDGSLYSVHHVLPEEMAGANLSKDDALALAQAWLAREKHVDLSQWKLVDSESTKQINRTDHSFTWEQLAALGAAPGSGESAHVRIELQVQGAEVSGFRTYVKIPEDWERRESQTTLAGTIGTVGFVGLLVVGGFAVLVIFFRNLKQPDMSDVPWRRIAKWAVIVLLAAAAKYIATMPLLLGNYSTEMPLKIFIATLCVVLPLFSLLLYTAVFFMLGLGWFFLARAFGSERLPGWSGMPAAYYTDAFCVALFGGAAWLGLRRAAALVGSRWPGLHHTLAAAVPSGLDSKWPAVSELAGVVNNGYFGIALLAVIAGFLCYGAMRRTGVRAALVVLVAILLAGGATASAFARAAVVDLIVLGIVWWGVTKLARFNMLGYFLLLAAITAAQAAAELLAQPNYFYHANGAVVAVVGALLLAWPLVVWRRAASRSAALGADRGAGA
ncbi:MAG: CPBP family intramembrane glutamic endopeptidase [Candidatus Acidiferrales bacterium]